MKRGMFVCPECGPRVRADEEACCCTCGADCAMVDYVPPDCAACGFPSQGDRLAERTVERDVALAELQAMRAVLDPDNEFPRVALHDIAIMRRDNAQSLSLAAASSARARGAERDAARSEARELSERLDVERQLVAELRASAGLR